MRFDTSLSCIGLSVGAPPANAPTPGPTPTPTPGPGPLTRLVAEGDSITFAAGSYAGLWADANPGVAFANHAGSGDGVSQLNARLPAMMVAEDPSHLTVLIGANDMTSYPATADYVAAVLDYVAAAKAIKPALKVGVCGLLPVDEVEWGHPGFNARRAAFNAAMRAAAGPSPGSGTIDFYIPLGDHPAMADAAGEDAALFPDGVHPSGLCHAIVAPVYAAVMDGILAEAAGSAPAAFVLADTGAEPSTVRSADTGPISGLGMGVAAMAGITGDGDFARGNADTGDGFGTGPVAVMNGDVVTVRVTSSDLPDTATEATLTIGGVSDTFAVTTSSASLTTIYRGGGASGGTLGWAADHTFAGVTFHAGKSIIAVMGELDPVPSAVSLDGMAGTKIAEVDAGANTIQFWEVVKGEGGTGDLVVTCDAINTLGFHLWSTDAAATFAEAQSVAFDFLANPVLSPSITLPAGGSIVYVVDAASASADMTAAAGCTEEADVVNGTVRRYFAGSRASTGQCGVNGQEFSGHQVLAIALEP